MKVIAIICNVFLLLMSAYLVMKHGLPKSSEDQLLFGALLAAPIVSLFALWEGMDEIWPFVYFKRKALEEKKKIEALTANRKS